MEIRNWRIIVDKKKSPAENMARDEAILNGLISGNSLPTIRFYDWNPSTVSCGYNQQVEKEIDFERLSQYGFGFVRRPTGGRMVLHDEEVTYSVIAPLEGIMSGSITETYAVISNAIAEGLKLCGIEVELEKGELTPEHQRQAANPCFGSVSKYELKYKNKKIVGSAQVRKQNCFLQHGSILLNFNQEKMADLLPGVNDSDRERLKKYLAKRTVAINQLIEIRIGYEEAVNNLIKGFKIAMKIDDCEISEINKWEIQESKRLIETKYETKTWNFKQSSV